ncbi:MAG TPA: ATP-binding protein [Burkholderiales bacterium]|nr:ATP-binding protein [Burkholderiales bacterium]
MSRLLPRSLYGRMVLILLGGFIAAQILGAVFLIGEGRRALRPGPASQLGQHIADVATMIEATPPAQRAQLLDRVGGPGFRVSGIRAAPAAAEAPSDRGLTADIAGEIARRSPSQRSVVVVDSGSPGPPSHGAIAVQLADGDWLRFELGPAAIGPPGPPAGIFLDLAWRFLVVVGIALFAVRLATRPLAVLAAAADQLGQDIRRPPLPENGPTEVRRAAHAFNQMQARLTRFIEDRARMLAAVSHDLKTPITRLRLRTELLDDGEVKNRFARDLEEMEQMVAATSDFLHGFGTARQREPVDVLALLEAIQSDAAELGGRVDISGAPHADFDGYAQGLKRCLANLVDNAVRYGGRAHLVVEDSDTTLTIRVQDDGPGVPEAELERIVEPFYRREESRSRTTGGTGLGLAIARDIARLHGGELDLSNRPQGGLEAVLHLPRRSLAEAPQEARAERFTVG